MSNPRVYLQGRRLALWFALVAPTLPGAALAQSTPPEKTAAQAAPDSKFAKQPGTLSDKLNASNGVIRPKEVDPKIEKPAPATGATPVIRPPGAPSVQPK